MAAQSQVYRGYSMGLRLQLCGYRMLEIIVWDVLSPILAYLVRKSRIQLQRGSLEMRLVGIITLKVEL